MSQQNGVAPSPASIQTTPPAHGSLTTTPASSLPSAPPLPALIGSSSVHNLPNSGCLSGIVSSTAQIPKLSASTTALLARVTGNLKGQQQPLQQQQKGYNLNFGGWNPSSRNLNSNSRINQTSKNMRVSSTLIELPTPPFVCLNRTATPAVSQKAITPTPSTPAPHLKFTGLVNIAPKPAGAPSSGVSSVGPPASTWTPTLPSQPLPPPAPRPLLPTLAPAVIATDPSAVVSVSAASKTPVPSTVTPVAPAPAPAPAPSSVAATTPLAPGPASHAPSTATTTNTTSYNPIVASLPAVAAIAKPMKRLSNSRQRRGPANGNKRSKKRRRGNDSDGEDIIRAGDSSSDESDFAPTATQTKSGRQVNRPSLYVPPQSSSPAIVKENSNLANALDKPQTKRKRVFRKGKEANINCMYCQRGHSPLSNTIVICDGCNRAWHQRCHDPPIENEVVTVKEKEWLCQECKPVRITILRPTVVRSNPSLGTGAQVPSVHIPIMLPSTEVGGERFSTNERRGYLSSLSHASLVELLVTLSDRQPELAMFPENLKDLRSSNFSFQPNPAPAAAVNATTAAPTLPPSPSVSANDPVAAGSANAISATGDEKADQPNVERSSTRRRRYYESSDEESEYEFEDHRLYPRAGNGVQLSNNPEDLDILREDAACPTFSYALHVPTQASA